MISAKAIVAIVASLAASVNGVWTKDTFKQGVYFGDSYTDTGRGMMGTKPPGWTEPAVSARSLWSNQLHGDIIVIGYMSWRAPNSLSTLDI
jgi:hypothetical protein